LRRRERVGNIRFGLGRVIHAHGHDERAASSHEVRALLGEPPFEPEVSFRPRLGVVGNERQEERAIADLPADRLVPDIAAAQFALVKPHLDAGGAQRIANGPRRPRILRCIT